MPLWVSTCGWLRIWRQFCIYEQFNMNMITFVLPWQHVYVLKQLQPFYLGAMWAGAQPWIGCQIHVKHAIRPWKEGMRGALRWMPIALQLIHMTKYSVCDNLVGFHWTHHHIRNVAATTTCAPQMPSSALGATAHQHLKKYFYIYLTRNKPDQQPTRGTNNAWPYVYACMVILLKHWLCNLGHYGGFHAHSPFQKFWPRYVHHALECNFCI